MPEPVVSELRKFEDFVPRLSCRRPHGESHSISLSARMRAKEIMLGPRYIADVLSEDVACHCGRADTPPVIIALTPTSETRCEAAPSQWATDTR